MKRDVAGSFRFGVEQRARLAAKAVPAPHVMYMTATPIPRTLALVEHGDLALCTINELPPGRSPVATRALTDSPASRALVRLLRLYSTFGNTLVLGNPHKKKEEVTGGQA